jgi:hypothetical protein
VALTLESAYIVLTADEPREAFTTTLPFNVTFFNAFMAGLVCDVLPVFNSILLSKTVSFALNSTVLKSDVPSRTISPLPNAPGELALTRPFDTIIPPVKLLSVPESSTVQPPVTTRYPLPVRVS